MTEPSFSVVTICFNDKANLEKTARSVLSQEGADLEWVVVDGASKDGTVEFLQDLSGRYQRLRSMSEPDKGIYDAFNKGVRLSRNRYITFICAGDSFCGPDTLKKVAAFATANPNHGLYYGDALEIDAAGAKFLRKARHARKIWWNLFTHHQAIFYDRSCFDRILYDTRYRIGGDYALTAELLQKGATAAQMPFETAQFLLGGTSQRNYWLGERENWVARRKLGTPIATCAAFYAAHALVRLGRTQAPGLYRILRYAQKPSSLAIKGTASGNESEAFDVRGIRVNCLSLQDATAKIFTEMTTGQSFCVNTLNMDHVVKLRASAPFKAAYGQAAYVLADGFPIVLAGRVAGCKVARATGADLVFPVCEEAARQGKTVALLGSTQDVLERCASILRERFPGLKIIDAHAPSNGFEAANAEASALIARYQALKPDVCFLALGAPKQEIFAQRLRDADAGLAFLSVGAALDFIAGAQRRAPLLLQRTNMEWAWRLANNPRRLAFRYAVSAIHVPWILMEAATKRRGVSTSNEPVQA